MCACTETDVRESANDCILASGEGHGSRGETLHPIPQQDPCPHPVNALYKDSLILIFVVVKTFTLFDVLTNQDFTCGTNKYHDQADLEYDMCMIHARSELIAFRLCTEQCIARSAVHLSSNKQKTYL
jgi:hypothetical protein